MEDLALVIRYASMQLDHLPAAASLDTPCLVTAALVRWKYVLNQPCVNFYTWPMICDLYTWPMICDLYTWPMICDLYTWPMICDLYTWRMICDLYTCLMSQ